MIGGARVILRFGVGREHGWDHPGLRRLAADGDWGCTHCARSTGHWLDALSAELVRAVLVRRLADEDETWHRISTMARLSVATASRHSCGGIAQLVALADGDVD